jgi:indolepyruvate ferredoxin oxidoreductase beta subunit
MAGLARHVGGLLAFDATALAREAGSPLAVNMVLLGALAAAGSLPFSPAELTEVIRTKTNPRFLESNLTAFTKGMEAAGNPVHWRRRLTAS